MECWQTSENRNEIGRRVRPGQDVTLWLGTWPIEPGQAVWARVQVEQLDGSTTRRRQTAYWSHNAGADSFWRLPLGSFAAGTRVSYAIFGRDPQGDVTGPHGTFSVGPDLHLALLWHQHQPIYKNTSQTSQAGSYTMPWVRMHALRDYYSMASILSQYPSVHATINLTPSLLWQLEDYLKHGATDQALELSLKDAARLNTDEQTTLLERFFDADRQHQIACHPRYQELYQQREQGRAFGVQALRDLQMWFNLAWFGVEFRRGEVTLHTGERISISDYVEKGRNFSRREIEDVLEQQTRLMRAVLPLHKHLQEQGQIELSTTPFFHPILPLLIDSDQATIDRPGTSLPERFAYPQDAKAHLSRAVDAYEDWFGCRPHGMWPAEGAVSPSIVPLLAQEDLRWMATDEGILKRSGRWGYQSHNPDIRCQPYRVEQGDHALSVFFRDTALSNDIGFHYASMEPHLAAKHFIQSIHTRITSRLQDPEDRVVSVILDGENAWGTYPEDGRPFLHALYKALSGEESLLTVTMNEYITGNKTRKLRPHPLETQTQVHDLFVGSWIDEHDSAPGNDLGTWIGEEEENNAWELLLRVRKHLESQGFAPETAPEAFEALYMAEGSDWFWWFGDDQDSGQDELFDVLFRTHLKNVYRHLGQTPPAWLEIPIVTQDQVWTPTQPFTSLQPGYRLVLRLSHPATVSWRLDRDLPQEVPLSPVGGATDQPVAYQLRFPIFPPHARLLSFSFRCDGPHTEHCPHGIFSIYLDPTP